MLAYRNRQYAVAADWLRAALALVPGGRPTPGELAGLCAGLCAALCYCPSCIACKQCLAAALRVASLICVQQLATGWLTGSGRLLHCTLISLRPAFPSSASPTPYLHPCFAGWEATLVNLGHTLRKLRQWDAAVACYLQALGLKPGQVRFRPASQAGCQ